VIAAVLEENGDNVEDAVPFLLQISDPDAAPAVPAQPETNVVDDEAFARQLAVTMQDEEFARQILEQEELLELERHQRAAASGQAAQIAEGNTAAQSAKPKKSFGSKIKSFFNSGSKQSQQQQAPIQAAMPSVYQPAPIPSLADDVPLRAYADPCS